MGELHRRSVEAAGQVAAVSDGAEWIQGFIDLHGPHATRILDLAHAAEHVAQIGHAVAPDDATWLAPRLHRLKHAGPESLLAELHQQVVALAPPPEVTEALTYLDKRVAFRQYPALQAAGWPIGSGSVESANKLVVEARLTGCPRSRGRDSVATCPEAPSRRRRPSTWASHVSRTVGVALYTREAFRIRGMQ